MVFKNGINWLFRSFGYSQYQHCRCSAILLGIVGWNGSEWHRQRKAGDIRRFPGRCSSFVGISCAAKGTHDSHLGIDWSECCPGSIKICLWVRIINGLLSIVDDCNGSLSLSLLSFCSLAIKSISMRLIQYRMRGAQERRGVRPKDNEVEYQNIEIYSTLISVMSTEILFYPFETILHRIQLQGTRTIIDNLDTGYSVVPILTSYEGAADCCRSTIATEGISGLYKGCDAHIYARPRVLRHFHFFHYFYLFVFHVLQDSARWFYNLQPTWR